MAQRTSTYTYGDVLSIAGKVTTRPVEDAHAQFIANAANNLIWMRYDWRETIATLPPFFLIPDEQDHGAPQVSIPTDFFGLRTAWIQRNLSAPPTRIRLAIIKNLEVTHVRSLPNAITYNSAADAFRVFPRVPPNIGSPDYMVCGEYKIRPTKVTATTLATTTLPFDDVYFQVWVDVMKWAILNFGGDPRAGEVSVQNGQTIYTGQLARAIAAIDEMATHEGLELGDPVIAPAEPLITPSGIGGGPWGFGW